MTYSSWKRATIAWLGFFILAFVNGTIRVVAIAPLVGETWARPLSVATGISLFTIYAYLLWKWLSIETVGLSLAVGAYWLVLTIAAETFLINRWMSGMSWQQILQTYNLVEGQLWPLVLLWVGLLPLVLLKVRNHRSL
ncbi:MAG: hypothetical protein KGQ93_14455 [Cyanobacteria bacterium REEB459]|nr:hypothetical protein [Cyanobacteria bacterium REEB459]